MFSNVVLSRSMAVAVAALVVVTLSLVRETTAGTIDGTDPKYREQIIRISKAAEMRNYINASHNPCENFYEFACGNYYSLNEPNLPSYKNNMLETISKALQRKFANMLNDNSTTDTQVERKVKDFYKSCTAVKPNSLLFGNQLKAIISEFGQMPMLAGAKWRENDFDWVNVVAQIYHRYGFRIILGCNVDVDMANSTVNRLRLDYQDMPFDSPSIYTAPVHAELRRKRQGLIATNLHNYFGVDEIVAAKTAVEIFDFETKFYEEETKNNGTKSSDDDEDDDDNDDDDDDDDDVYDNIFINLTTIEELHSKYYPQFFDVNRLVRISMGGYIPKEKVYDFLEDDAESTAKLLQRTPKRIVANYIYYYLLENFMINFSTDQKKKCISETKKHFAKVMDNMVYRKYTTKQTEQDVKYMWETIKAAFHSVLHSKKLTWMKEETRNYALEKLSAMTLEINSYENTNLTAEFSRLNVSDKDFMENKKTIFAFEALQQREKLNQTYTSFDSPLELSFSPVHVVTENTVKIPVAILQPYYLWSDYYPNALKFGTLGFLISHELIHGFDAEGRFFDKNGRARKWWDVESSRYFNNRTQCFNKQYQNFKYNGRFLPELSTQSENIADNGGIQLAYDAYLKWYEDSYRSFQRTDMESLPRISYTNKQLFFISYGQLWCSATHEALRDFVASTDNHVPENIRVIAPLANFDAFSKEFHCPIGSYMNPKDKCIIY